MRYRVVASTLAEPIKAQTAKDALAAAEALEASGATDVKIRNESGAWFTVEEMQRVIASVRFG